MIYWVLWPLFSVSIGTAIFLFSSALDFTVHQFQSFPFLVYVLPLAGLFLAWTETLDIVIKNRLDTNKILIEIKKPDSVLSWRMPFFIGLSTFWSQLFGASTGRESTAIQIGAAIADSTNLLIKKTLKKFKLVFNDNRPLILRMGLAGGFAAAFGVTFAAVLFVIEMTFSYKDLRQFSSKRYLVFCKEITIVFLTAWGALNWALFLGLSYLKLPISNEFKFIESPTKWLLACAALAILANIYNILFISLRAFFEKFALGKSLFIGGTVVSTTAFILQTTYWHGLGTDLIAAAFSKDIALWQSPLKAGLTLISTACGFRGGEVVPLMATGSLIGNSLGHWLDLPFIEMSSAGLVLFFSLRLRCPGAAFLFLIEQSGNSSAFFALPALIFSNVLYPYIQRRLQLQVQNRSTLTNKGTR